jgi:hypothetical protein
MVRDEDLAVSSAIVAVLNFAEEMRAKDRTVTSRDKVNSTSVRSDGVHFMRESRVRE